MRASSEAILWRAVTTHKALTTNKSLCNKMVFFILQSSFSRCSRWGEGDGHEDHNSVTHQVTDDAGKSLPHPNRGISLEANLKDCFKTSQPHYNTWLIPRIPQGTSAALKSLKVKVTQLCPTLCNPVDYTVSPWNSPSQNTGVGIHFLLQQIFPTQELNQGLLHCRRVLYQLSYQGSPLQSLNSE